MIKCPLDCLSADKTFQFTQQDDLPAPETIYRTLLFTKSKCLWLYAFLIWRRTFLFVFLLTFDNWSPTSPSLSFLHSDAGDRGHLWSYWSLCLPALNHAQSVCCSRTLWHWGFRRRLNRIDWFTNSSHVGTLQQTSKFYWGNTKASMIPFCVWWCFSSCVNLFAPLMSL